MIQTYTFSSVARQIDALGVHFRYESGSDSGGNTSITVYADGSCLGRYEPGDQVDLPHAGKRWEIVPSSSGCWGTVRIGMGKVTSAKLVGTVSVINGERARVKSGQAFLAKFYTGQGITLSAGQFSAGMLRNPTGSGKNILISRLSAFAVSKGSDRTDSAAYMAFAMGPEGLFGAYATAPTQPKNKLSGGAASVAVCCRCPDGSPKVANAASADMICEGTSLAQQAFPLELTEPIILPPGHALMVYVLNAFADCILQFTEEVI